MYGSGALGSGPRVQVSKWRAQGVGFEVQGLEVQSSGSRNYVLLLLCLS